MTEISIWLAVATGGALGAVLRGLLFRAVERWSAVEAGGQLARFGTAPSTLAVNMMGSLGLGLAVARLPDPLAGVVTHDPMLAFWVTGLCGAVTTFSALCADAIGLARRGHRVGVAVVLLTNMLLSITALMLGLAIAG